MLRFIPRIVLLITLTFYICLGFAENVEPLIINAVVTTDKIEFFPNTIPENTSFIIHVINKTNTPIELENSDTSVEIYANMDKTFKVGLSAGDYTFFNDFNTHTSKAILFVKPIAAIVTQIPDKKVRHASMFLDYYSSMFLHCHASMFLDCYSSIFLHCHASMLLAGIQDTIGTGCQLKACWHDNLNTHWYNNLKTCGNNNLKTYWYDNVKTYWHNNSFSYINNTSSSHINISEILFVIWRESVEALLVVGVVYNWLKQLESGRRSGFFFLWLGVAIGLFCSLLLSFLLVKVSHLLSPHFATIFQASMTLIAAIMIVYMVKWMRGNSRTLKSTMHHSLEKNQMGDKKSNLRWRNISILTVVSVAFAREASEASIFIYALSMGNTDMTIIKMISLLLIGILLAIGTIYLLQLGNKIFSWRFFFKCTEILLLLLGGGLLLNCIDSLILSGILTPLYKNIWNTSFLMSEGGMISPILSSFTGYRATPSLMDIIAYSLYWLVIYFLLRNKKGYSHAA